MLSLLMLAGAVAAQRVGCEDSTTWVDTNGNTCAVFRPSYCSDHLDAAGVSAATACPVSCDSCPCTSDADCGHGSCSGGSCVCESNSNCYGND